MEIIAKDNKCPEKKEFQLKSLRNLKQSLGKLLGRRCVTITEYDPTYKVSYLGNVLTGWAKGEACTEKPLNTLWKNYSSHSKPDVQMKLTVTQSGLKAVTKEHGLTEYWSHRITFCCATKELPRIFCWVYRHEGRKLKQELRCHAVLCSKESTARLIATQLQTRLTQALIEFKRDKISRQNARLSLANSVYENPSLPRRKILLSTGSQNYRPPLERSKSAPKLMSIEECLEEEEDTCNEIKKSIRTYERSKSGTYRNLTFSNRGNKLGGLHCLRRLEQEAEDIPISNSDQNNNSQNDMCLSLEKSSQCLADVAQGCTEIVEDNPFGSYLEEVKSLWKSPDCSLLESINRALDLKKLNEISCAKESNNKDEVICETNLANFSEPSEDKYEGTEVCRSEQMAHRNSWAGEQLACVPIIPSYTEVVNEYINEFGSLPDYQDIMLVEKATKNVDSCDSLVENHKRQPEYYERSKSEGDKDNILKQDEDDSKCKLSMIRNLVQDRRRLYESLIRQEAICKEDMYDSVSEASLELDENTNVFPNFKCDKYSCDDHANRDMLFMKNNCHDKYDSDMISCFDEESTPSLQSLSSGSDTSSPRDIKLGFPKNYDLDSLWEEGSDESGFVEACQETADDKIRDVPHHHLMKNCILTSKSHCLQV